MLLPLAHEVLGPGLHRFVFPSESREGVTHELLLDLEEEGPGRLTCLCEASLYGKVCKHKRLFILGLEILAEAESPPDRRARPEMISFGEKPQDAHAEKEERDDDDERHGPPKPRGAGGALDDVGPRERERHARR